MIFLDIVCIRELLEKHGLKPFFRDLIKALEEDFSQWEKFEKSSRVASHSAKGVIELMPTANDDFYSFKYVNGHPSNPQDNKLSVFAFGCLADNNNGYPILLTEMTILTALRTAATTAMASKHLANQHSKTLAIIGTGAQSEFMALAHECVFPLKEIRFFDIKAEAMNRFAQNLKEENIQFTPCSSVEEAVEGSDILITCTASKQRAIVLQDAWVKEGMHINGIGGDCPGKTELDPKILHRSSIFVEHLPQTEIEGEIQCLDETTKKQQIIGELWEIISKKKKGRKSEKDITLFDSVGFAIEDFSIMRLCEKLSKTYGIGKSLDLIPKLDDPKNLFSLIRKN